MIDSKDWTDRRGINDGASSKGDGRSAYEKDRARLVHSAGFRRLQAKTQVLGIGEGDFHRTRLTHSVEVAQIGNGIARNLEHREPSAEGVDWLPARDLIETICLAHDLGHPPFGHGGEQALNDAMLNFGGFEGNGQTLRIICKLEDRDPEYGLNPTRRAVLGVIKYPMPYSALRALGDAPQRKPPKCFHDDEIDIFDWVMKPFTKDDRDEFSKLQIQPTENAHGKTKYKSFDTSILELADDIAYGVHDFEDGVALGLITEDDLNPLSEEIDHKWAHRHGLPLKKHAFHKYCKLDSSARKRMTGAWVNALITSVHVLKRDEFVHPLLAYNAALEEPAHEALEILKKIVIQRVIKIQTVQTLEYCGKRMVSQVFDALNSDPERLMSRKFALKWKAQESETKKARTVCDYVAGMTDEYATKMYERLFMPREGHVFDRL